MAIPIDTPVAAVTAWAVPDALKQTLVNLIDNALRHAASGRTLNVEVRVAGDIVRIAVCDRGPGIPGAMRSRIFDAFSQGDAELHTKRPGLGLGLSISRGLMRAAGGDLLLAPREGAGACFVIQLPKEEP